MSSLSIVIVALFVAATPSSPTSSAWAEGDLPVHPVANPKALLKSRATFEVFTKYWRYVCALDDVGAAETDELLDSMKRNIPATVFEGLKTLETVNRPLTYASLRNHGVRPLEFNCNDGKKNSTVGHAYFHAHGAADGADRIGFNHSSDDFRTFTKTVEIWVQANIFHEFLHAIRADNQSYSGHQHLDGRALEFDVIYACSAQAFPGIMQFLDRNDQLRDNTRDACETCVRARRRKFEWSWNPPVYLSNAPEVLAQAAQICEGILR